ncbi:CPBP family glutamic-type intramembrane protease, partial [Flavobacterium filum]|uniref:CPBP family glutamic-type intramembrane protease n=1 Tax=Flavobacterium filum TaxID=370974 RepID=UPI0023F57538
MYIVQVNNKKFNIILYLPIPLVFLGLVLVNFITTSDVNTEELLQMIIDKFGTNLTFALMVGQLAFCCLVLLLWVKFIHGQSITSLTTSRKKIDWKRVFFSFSVWGSFTAITTLILYWLSPESFVFNFEPDKFYPFLLLAILLIPLQTSFEEYFFRAYLMQGIGVVTKSRLIPLLITSVTFGLMHIANPEVGKLGMIIMVYYIG